MTSVVATVQELRVGLFATAEEFRGFFKGNYGPTIAIYRANADDPEKVAALDADLDALGRRFLDADGVMGWECLVLTANTV